MPLADVLPGHNLQGKLGIQKSTLKKLIRSELEPPKSVEFIERIRRLPGVTDEHIERLLHAANAPNWLVIASQHYRQGDVSEHRAEIVMEDGISIFVGVRLDLNKFDERELDELTG